MLWHMNALIPILAIFFGSFLLFGIQPMLGRTLLPPFGGSAAVWTVCLAAYQILLLVGYGYAHLIAKRSARVQRVTHLVLLSLAVAWTFCLAALRMSLKSRLGNSAAPSLEVLLCVLLFVGLPYVLLSANSTLIQSWLAKAGGGRAVYKLYAVSNLGSLLGLLVYPFLLEPYVSLNAQWYGFAACLLLYVALLARVARGTQDLRPPTSDLRPPPSDLRSPTSDLQPPISDLPPPLTRPWLWLALPALSTFLLNAVTVHLSTDVTPVPLMWVGLLTAYLLSFILGFSVVGEKGLVAWAGLAVLTLLAAAYISGRVGGMVFLPNLACGLLLVLVCGTCLHGWLYRIRPESARLTHFYLAIAAGGALGGVSASLLAPVIFDRVWEYPLALLAACAACAWLLRTWNHPELKGLSTFLAVAASLAAVLTVHYSVKGSRLTIARARNFYGCLRVEHEQIKSRFGDAMPMTRLYHGETIHGIQMRDRLLKNRPTSYYGPKGGGLAVTAHPRYAKGAPLRVGVIGLGTGTMATYGRTNDLYRFFEINPQVLQLATNTHFFSFVADSAACVDVSLGDARKRLEEERTLKCPQYDVLVVDAFSGDSIPYHLSTREAFQLYLDRLAPEGILALHISNWHIDLTPLCKAAAATFGLKITGLIAMPEEFSVASLWVYLTRETTPFAAVGTREMNWAQVRDFRLPCDEKGSLLPLVRFGHTPPKKDLDIDLSNLTF